MKAVILAGGLGTRISEESHLKPKPMIEIGGRPILWHIMKIYAANGITDFVICCGYKGYVIKEYFANYFLHMSDVTFHMDENRMEVHRQQAEPWKVTLVDTGESHHDRWSHQARGRPYRQHFLPDLRRRCCKCQRIEELVEAAQGQRTGGHGHGDSTARTIRRSWRSSGWSA